MSSMFYPLTISEVTKETKDAIVVGFLVPDNISNVFEFKAGQYITLSTEIDGQSVRRSYSICSSPQDKKLSVAIKKVEGGIFSTYANQYFKIGDIINVMPPNGNFGTTINSTQTKQYLALASGSGITPIMSIVKTILQTENESKITLVYSNKTRPSIIFFEQLEALKNKYLHRFQLIHLLSREKIASPLNYGRIDEAKLNELKNIVKYSSFDEIFICGPEQMILTTKEFLLHHNIEKQKIHFELFGTAKKQTSTKNITVNDREHKSNITIILDGRTTSFTLATKGNSILDQALQHGADLPYACKGGVCCTCKAKLIEGSVSMDINYALEEEEVAAGFVLACQAHPTSPNVILDFDIK